MCDILFLAHRVPYPPDRGDKIRSFHLLKFLAARARVHLVAFGESEQELAAAAPLQAFTASCALMLRSKSRPRAALEALASGRSVSETAFADTRMGRAVAAVMAREPIGIVFAFSGQMAQYVPPHTDARVLVDFVDMDSAKFAGYAERGSLPLRWLMRREARLLERFERRAAACADASLFVSEAEAALFRSRTGAARVVAVENGIDAGAYDPARNFPRPGVPGRPIVFTGQMDYPPNIEAACWFVREVLPLVRQEVPGAHLAIVGRAPTAKVRALAGDNVTVTGEVEDVRGWLAHAEVAVAPLRLARGVQNKVLEAMAMARPVVASPAAAEGIDHGGTIRVADDAPAFAAAVLRLLGDRAAADCLGAAARRQVIERYDWSARLAALEPILGVAPKGARAAA